MGACTSKGTGQYVAGEGHIYGWPSGYRADATVRGVLVMRGAAGDHMSSVADVQDLAARGFPCIAADFGSTSGGLWGNDTVLTRMTQAWTFLKTRLNVQPDRVLLSAGSGGGLNMLNWMRANPGSVAAAEAVIPAIGLRDIHDNNRDNRTAEIESVYGGAAAYNAAAAQKDPSNNVASVPSVPLRFWYSTSDPICIPSITEAFVAAHPTAELISMGAVGHAVANVPPGAAAEFLAPYA